jgi:hypothetical protein
MNYSISGQLLNLYLFIFGEITHANIQKNPDKLNPIIEISKSSGMHGKKLFKLIVITDSKAV